MRRNNEQGSALIVALLMLMGLGFAGACIVMLSAMDHKASGEDRRGTQAQFVAEAGVEEVLGRLSRDPGTTVTINGNTFDPAIRDAASPPDVNWETRIYLPGAANPVSLGSTFYTPTVQVASSALDYVRNGQYVTVRHRWRDRDADNARDANEIVRYDSGKFPPENFDTGSPIEVITVEGHRGEARRRLQVEATRFPFSPNVIAALSSDRGVDVRGNVTVCGHNHRVNTPVGTDLGSPCSPNWDEATGHRPAITTTGDEVDRRGSTDLLGDPAATDTSSTNPFYSLAQCLGVTQDVIDQILAHADHTSMDADPLEGITYVQGNASANSMSGQGLLYVTGDLSVHGGFEWKGLIYVEGDLTIGGNAWVLGAVMVRGRSDYAFSGGNPGILYSSEMVRLALEAAFQYIVLSWKEY